jgi:hypothetical protein
VVDALKKSGFKILGKPTKNLKVPVDVKCMMANHILGSKLYSNLIESKKKFPEMPCPLCRLNAKCKEKTIFLSAIAANDGCRIESEYQGQHYPLLVTHHVKQGNHTFSIIPKYALQKKKIKCDICFPGTRKTTMERLRLQANQQLTFLFNDYENDRSKVDVCCNDCAAVYPTSISNLKDGVGCRFCQGKEPLTKKMMRDWLNRRNDLAVVRSLPLWKIDSFDRDDEYKPICQLRCMAHGPFTCNAIQLRASNAGCDKCGRVSGAMKSARSFEAVKEMFNSKFPIWTLNTQKDEYLAQIGQGSNLRKLSYTCDNGHSNKSSIGNLLYSIQSCRECINLNRSRVAAKCISTIENLLSTKVHKEFPISTKNLNPINGYSPKRSLLYIDGFCEKYKFGFEYQGDQHFRFIPYFHESLDEFERQKAYDKLKKIYFERIGLALIEISENELTVKSSENEFIRVISSKLVEIGIQI